MAPYLSQTCYLNLPTQHSLYLSICSQILLSSWSPWRFSYIQLKMVPPLRLRSYILSLSQPLHHLFCSLLGLGSSAGFSSSSALPGPSVRHPDSPSGFGPLPPVPSPRNDSPSHPVLLFIHAKSRCEKREFPHQTLVPNPPPHTYTPSSLELGLSSSLIQPLYF